MNGPDGFLEPLPLVIIFSFFLDDIQTLKDIDDIIDSPPLDTQFYGDFIELYDVVAFSFEMINKLLGEFFKAFSLSVISEYFFIQKGLFPGVWVSGVKLGFILIFHLIEKDGNVVLNEWKNMLIELFICEGLGGMKIVWGSRRKKLIKFHFSWGLNFHFEFKISKVL